MKNTYNSRRFTTSIFFRGKFSGTDRFLKTRCVLQYQAMRYSLKKSHRFTRLTLRLRNEVFAYVVRRALNAGHVASCARKKD